MSLEQIESEEEYEVGSPTEFVHKPASCMTSLSTTYHVGAWLRSENGYDDIMEYHTNCGKTALLIGERVLIDEAP